MKIIIAGCDGRLGFALLQYAFKEQLAGRCQLVGGTVKSNSPNHGKELSAIASMSTKGSGLKATSDIESIISQTDAIIDFSTPIYSLIISDHCTKHGIIHICGTTGFNKSQLEQLNTQATCYPLFYSVNMSFGVTLIAKMVTELAAKLTTELYDSDILDIHHKHKIDAPSGTALMLAEMIAQGYGITPSIYSALDSKESRKTGDIGISSIRTGKTLGSHEITFASEGETIKMVQQTHNLNVYCHGAFSACYWMRDKPKGRIYSMFDLLN